MIDLRSDTVTRPSEAMIAAMAQAEVGDDQFGEDPSVNQLQERVADMCGKEAALWVPTGTMANQVALRTLTRPGDDVVVTAGAHVVWSETGAGAANAGVQFTELGGDAGHFDSEAFAVAVKPSGHVILPPTTLVSIENTHNRSGGRVAPLATMVQVCSVARDLGVRSYLDGARLWNASIATGHTPAELAEPFELVWVAFSKGLGAPGGSMLAGSRDDIVKAHRYRRMLGGAMRQIGSFAAAADHALDHHIDDLAADHANASLIAEVLAASDQVSIDPTLVETNIVVFEPSSGAPSASRVVDMAAARGVASFAFGNVIRVVTHRDVTSAQCREAAEVLVGVLETDWF
ncbi:GntG family PLP-dependent aldolase [soil metagenome]